MEQRRRTEHGRRWPAGVFAALMFLPAISISAEIKPIVILFYDPDANHQSLVSAAAWFNDYLRNAQTNAIFQPVQRYAQVEKLLGETSFAITPAAFVTGAQRHMGKPLLLPEANGATSYRKHLVDRAPAKDAPFVATNVATTLGDNNADATAGILRLLKSGGIASDKMVVIPVTKDIDALLALSFGHVQSALVTRSSLDVLGRLNPSAAQSLRTVYDSPRIQRTPFSAVGDPPSDVEKRLVSLLLAMDRDDAGRKALKAIGFDRWVPYAPMPAEGK